MRSTPVGGSARVPTPTWLDSTPKAMRKVTIDGYRACFGVLPDKLQQDLLDFFIEYVESRRDALPVFFATTRDAKLAELVAGAYMQCQAVKDEPDGERAKRIATLKQKAAAAY